ncbi:MAG: hypothetical protein EBR82_71770, partial [Caulobacteraceae bacterium]|nr:hypothetical protein [Caulobacteraceae bacterium]
MELAKNFPSRTIITIDWTGEPTMVSAQVSEQPNRDDIASRCRDLKNVKWFNTNSRNLNYDSFVNRFGRIGLIFIDGDHSHDGVQRDTELAMAYARDNGTVIAWHDYQEPAEGNEWIGVKDVLDYWVKDQSLHLTEIKGTRTGYTTQWAHPTVPEPQQMPQGYVQPKSNKYAFRDYCGGNSIWDHMVRLADLAAECNGVIVEVGSGCGDGSTHAFDLGLAENPNEFKRHISVNLHPVGGGWEPERSYWSFVQGDSREDDTVMRADLKIAECEQTYAKGIGIIYIDTEHSYECLKRELEIWPDIGDE